MKHSTIHLKINLSQVAATTETKWIHYDLQLEQIGLAEFFPHIIFLQNLSESLFLHQILMIKKRENEYVSYDDVLCLNSSFMYVESKLFGFYFKNVTEQKSVRAVI